MYSYIFSLIVRSYSSTSLLYSDAFLVTITIINIATVAAANEPTIKTMIVVLSPKIYKINKSINKFLNQDQNVVDNI